MSGMASRVAARYAFQQPFLFEEGDIVRSTYRAQWIGVVTGRTKRSDAPRPLYEVRVVLDQRHRPVHKHIRAKDVRMDESWLQPYTPRDTAEDELIRTWFDPLSGASDLPPAGPWDARRFADEVR